MKLNPLFKLLALFLLIIAFAIPQHSFGQKGVDWGLSVGPEYSTRIFFGSENHVASPQLGLSLHGHAQFQLNTHLSLDIGLGYGLKRFKDSFKSIHQLRADMSPLITTISYKTVLHCVELPVLLKYYFGGKKTGVYAGIGITPILFFRTVINDWEIINPYDHIGYPDHVVFNQLQLKISPQIAFGVRHPINAQLDLNLELYGNIVPWYLFWGNDVFVINSGIRAGLWF